jgi:hypothetical protein
MHPCHLKDTDESIVGLKDKLITIKKNFSDSSRCECEVNGLLQYYTSGARQTAQSQK